MRFKVDENLPVEVAGELRRAGYDASTVFEQHRSGSADEELAALCQRENLVFVTLDRTLPISGTTRPRTIRG